MSGYQLLGKKSYRMKTIIGHDGPPDKKVVWR